MRIPAKRSIINSQSDYKAKLDEKAHQQNMISSFEKQIEENEVMYEEFMMDDAEICVVAYGIASRISQNAIVEARKQGIKVGMIRPITLWPFPKKALAAAADKVKSFVSVELSMGQMIDDIELAIRCKKPVLLCNRVGGMIPTVENVLEKICEADKVGGAK